MKTISNILIALILGISTSIAQQDLSNYKSIDGVFITSYWGDVKVNAKGNAAQDFNLSVNFTDTSKKTKTLDDLKDYVTFEVINKTLYISARKPKGFESLDFILNLPKDLFLQVELLKGGNIYASHLANGTEINSLNGSVKLEHLGKYALVNAANGEITASFDRVDKSLPISLVTMNGGVTVTLPKSSKRDVRLISRKNGYVSTDFDLKLDRAITNLNVRSYSKTPIISTATINGGGALVFLSTENGPVAIKTLKS